MVAGAVFLIMGMLDTPRILKNSPVSSTLDWTPQKIFYREKIVGFRFLYSKARGHFSFDVMSYLSGGGTRPVGNMNICDNFIIFDFMLYLTTFKYLGVKQ